AFTASIAARRGGRSRPSSGGSDTRAGSRANVSPATRATSSGSRKTWSESELLPQRHRAGLPAGTIRTEPAGGGTTRLTPSYRASNSVGVRRNRRSEWWGKGGWSGPLGGWEGERGGSRPTHPRRTLTASGPPRQSLVG